MLWCEQCHTPRRSLLCLHGLCAAWVGRQGTNLICLNCEQGATYYGSAWAHRDTSPLFTSTYCPALLIEVLGPTVRVSALYWLDKVCMVRHPPARLLPTTTPRTSP